MQNLTETQDLDELRLNELKDEKRRRSKNILLRSIEIYVYIIIAAILLYLKLQLVVKTTGYHEYGLGYLLLSSDFLWGTAIVLVPMFFALVFNSLPFEYLRDRIINKTKPEYNYLASLQEVEYLSATEYFSTLTKKSEKLSKVLFTRGGVYLFIGCLIGLGGLLYFSSTFKPDNYQEFKTMHEPLTMFTRFGGFIFLELLAFFFLKQYRFTMDDFRYYEGIQRTREEKLFFIKYLDSKGLQKELLELLKESNSSDTIHNGDSSLILESKKLHKDEFEILNKIIDKIS